ncbi:carbonic anhydrase [Trichodelitschia bisporula]|uniref:Carbonic anhydrase n=1 Tax=Trichodelitschia bisporula TaxID=703511 RepID=A0A6G1HJ08_9PEZI|nr:carbonic anhydrase [Trichodelitschia bisporula]
MAVTPPPLAFTRTPVHRGLIPSTSQAGLPASKPQVLWLGCSSSGFHETRPLGLETEELLVHRNIGNLFANHDLSTESSVEYALRILKVKHIVVCGHYGCKFVTPDQAEDSPTGPWLKSVVDLYDSLKPAVDRAASTPADCERIFAELNAWKQAQDLKSTPSVQEAVRERGLQVHAFMYDPVSEECWELAPKDKE